MVSKYKNQPRILVVDDTPENIQLLNDVLLDRGIIVTMAKNGRQALKSVSIKIPDLILLDIAMPDMDGFEVCQELKKNPATASIPVIFVTARTETDDIVHGFELGAVDYVTKPFNIAELLARIDTHLDLKFSHDTINEQNERLKLMDATKDRLFSILSKDLKLPVHSIADTSAKTLTNFEKVPATELKTVLTNIQQNSERVASMLTRLNYWALLISGKTDPKPRRFDIDLLIKDSMAAVKRKATDKGINILYENPKTRMVLADYDMTLTVMQNLLSNAIKFTNQGGDVIISTKDFNEQSAEITVYDTGVGIKEEDKNKLFKQDIFFTTQGTAKETGIGLGLIIAYQYIQLMNGKLWVESMPGIGSDFKFTLPNG